MKTEIKQLELFDTTKDVDVIFPKLIMVYTVTKLIRMNKCDFDSKHTVYHCHCKFLSDVNIIPFCS